MARCQGNHLGEKDNYALVELSSKQFTTEEGVTYQLPRCGHKGPRRILYHDRQTLVNRCKKVGRKRLAR